jgi:hypothetical protein
MRAAGPRVRLALVTTVGCAIAVLVPSLLATAGDAPSAVVLAAVAMAVAATAVRNSLVASSAGTVLPPPPCGESDVPVLLGGLVTDPVHHPLRPRAPGLA